MSWRNFESIILLWPLPLCSTVSNGGIEVGSFHLSTNFEGYKLASHLQYQWVSSIWRFSFLISSLADVSIESLLVLSLLIGFPFGHQGPFLSCQFLLLAVVNESLYTLCDSQRFSVAAPLQDFIHGATLLGRNGHHFLGHSFLLLCFCSCFCRDIIWLTLCFSPQMFCHLG